MAQDPSTRRSDTQLLRLIPNMVTIVAICAGLTSIRFSIAGEFAVAVYLILLAVVLDGLDGRLARLLKAESPIGAELDSLADFLNFGVAPGLMVFISTFDTNRSFGWFAVMVLAICSVLRLARFNVDSRAAPAGTKARHFTGVPAPAGAFLVMVPIFHMHSCAAGDFCAGQDIPNWAIALYMLFVGFLMISRIPTPSPKSISIPREKARFVYIALVILLWALWTYFWQMLMGISVVYLVAVLISALRNLRRKTDG